MADARKTTTASKRAAQVAEAARVAVTVEHNGVEYDVPPALDLPVAILDVDKEIDVLKLILGAEQWKLFADKGGVDGKPAKLGDFAPFAEKVVEAAGFDELGN